MSEEYGMVYRKNKTMFVIGKHCASDVFWNNQEVRQQVKDIVEARPHRFTLEAAADIFMLGYIHGKRAERARRGREVQKMRIDDIKIFPCFAEHEPKPEKMQQKEQYFTETGLLQSQIILDSRDNLIDGYTSYLLARAHGIQCVPIRYGRRQIVRASHKPGGKLFTWELPGILLDRVSAGDKVLIHTQRGVRVVTVAAVEEYAGNEPEPLRMVIRVKRKGGVA